MSTLLTRRWGYTAHPVKENPNSKSGLQSKLAKWLQRVKEEAKRRLKMLTATLYPKEAAPTGVAMRWHVLASFDNSPTRMV
jgi:hypothetical protein